MAGRKEWKIEKRILGMVIKFYMYKCYVSLIRLKGFSFLGTHMYLKSLHEHPLSTKGGGRISSMYDISE